MTVNCSAASVSLSAKDPITGNWDSNNPNGDLIGLIRTGYYVGTETLPQVEPPTVGTVLDITEYNTQLVRVTDSAAVNGGDSVISAATFLRHSYSRVSPFNADGTYLQGELSSGWHVIVDASDYSIVHRISHTNFPGSNSENHWHPTNPDLYLYGGLNGGLVFRAHSVSGNSQSVYFDLTNLNAVRKKLGDASEGTSITAIFPTAARARWRAEGQPSNDGDHYFFQIEATDFSFLGLVSYDLSSNEIVSYLEIGDVVTNYDNGAATWTIPSGNTPDHSSTSMTGNFGIVSYAYPVDQTWALKFTDLSKGVQLLNGSQHSDLGLMPSGNDVFCVWAQTDDSTLYPGVGSIGGYIVATEFMLDGSGNPDVAQRIRLNNLRGYSPADTEQMSTDLHISCRGYNKPGWLVLSTYGESYHSAKAFADHKILICEIATNGDILHVGSSFYSGFGGYFGEIQASTNKDLTKIVFTSDWVRNEDVPVINTFASETERNTYWNTNRASLVQNVTKTHYRSGRTIVWQVWTGATAPATYDGGSWAGTTTNLSDFETVYPYNSKDDLVYRNSKIIVNSNGNILARTWSGSTAPATYDYTQWLATENYLDDFMYILPPNAVRDL